MMKECNDFSQEPTKFKFKWIFQFIPNIAHHKMDMYTSPISSRNRRVSSNTRSRWSNEERTSKIELVRDNSFDKMENAIKKRRQQRLQLAIDQANKKIEEADQMMKSIMELRKETEETVSKHLKNVEETYVKSATSRSYQCLTIEKEYGRVADVVAKAQEALKNKSSKDFEITQKIKKAIESFEKATGNEEKNMNAFMKRAVGSFS